VVDAPDPEQLRDPDEPLRADDARVAFDSITRIARQVELVRGRRKSLIWFGEGIAYDMFDAKGGGRLAGARKRPAGSRRCWPRESGHLRR